MAAMYNTNNGPGSQNNNQGNQSVNYGGDQNIAGRDFVKIFNTTISNAHKSLWDAVVGIGASHTAEQQFERGHCLEGTREKVLKVILDWLLSNGGQHPICWLSGTAGVGKSAIAMSVAKSCENDSLVSSFFFFRSDPKRNNPSALVLTIAHGLVVNVSSCRDLIHQRILDDPTILEAQMELQFRELVLRPYAPLVPLVHREASTPRRKLVVHQAPSGVFQRLYFRQRSLRQKLRGLLFKLTPPKEPVVEGTEKDPNLVIIDGLDECSDEESQLRILSTILYAFQQPFHFPLKFLICSRPESWIREAFAAEPLAKFTKIISLNDSFSPGEDIMRYYVHHFREIAQSPKYSQVRFPSPWPSAEDLEILVRRSCGQFVFAVTVVKFVRLAYNHPITQLQIILDNAPDHPGPSPYHELDALYHAIINANPNTEQVLPILAAILILPGHLEPTPAHIELLLGMPSGQVALTLRAMHSVLDIHDWEDKIVMHHTSFRDYLVDRSRSGHFHIDVDAQTPAIARQWLQSLTAGKMSTYRYDFTAFISNLLAASSHVCLSSSEQLYDHTTHDFFAAWIQFCVQSIPGPTTELLDDLRNVDLASVFYCQHAPISSPSARKYLLGWDQMFGKLASWAGKHNGGDGYEDAVDTEEYLCKESDQPDSGNEDVVDGCDESDDRGDQVFTKDLKVQFRGTPHHFHLEPPSGAREDFHWVILLATGCRWRSRLTSRADDAFRCLAPPPLTNCHCDLSEGKESEDPKHLAYQEACIHLVEAFVSDFEAISRIDPEDTDAKYELNAILGNLVDSSLLRHCLIDERLLSLCDTFFEVARSCALLHIPSEWGERRRTELLKWIEVSPRFMPNVMLIAAL
ncbi:hypothetical protein PQX77_020912 [Marasmius sp. AFHP31]|nr:hypothetical protein PQX77_020912 [Marasmius sp. AFHP31]